jgi:hypothetical protein
VAQEAVLVHPPGHLLQDRLEAEGNKKKRIIFGLIGKEYM